MNTRMPDELAQSTQTGLSAQLPINKIVVVGHPLSGFETVESLLNRCGMQVAAPSKREGLSPVDIGATLLKAHRIVPLDALQTHGAIHSLQPGPVWQSLALDLLLGNIDHELWGWSDPQAVYLLDYWKDLDPQLAFMLVYDTPQDLIARAFDNPANPCTPEALQTAVDNWQAYNEALLYFYHRNPQRCMLVHAAQVRESAADYLQQVQLRIGAPLGDAGEPTAKPLPAAPAAPSTHTALRRYLAQHIVDAQPQALTLYQELQAVASLPHAAPVSTSQQPAPATLALEALQNLLEQQQHQQSSIRHMEAAQSRVQTLELEQSQLRQDLRASQSGQTEGQQENDLLLTQLHQVQEELEKLYLQCQGNQLELQALAQARTEAEKAKVHAETAQAKAKAEAEAAKTASAAAAKAAAALVSAEQERAKALAEQLAASAASAASAATVPSIELQQENDLLLAQLHQVQEELERYYLENQRLKAKPAAPAKPATAPAPYGAAERVKQQLSYRLGSKMIERSHSLGGWLGMPFALLGVAREYKRELPQRKASKQPPIEKYRDAYEAERMKQHLSYRLGAALIKHGKNPLRWPALPFALNKARQEWLRQRTR